MIKMKKYTFKGNILEIKDLVVSFNAESNEQATEQLRHIINPLFCLRLKEYFDLTIEDGIMNKTYCLKCEIEIKEKSKTCPNCNADFVNEFNLITKRVKDD